MAKYIKKEESRRENIMKKTRKIKSIFALLMALVMTLGLAVNVFAAGENATITVTGDKEFEGKAVTAVQMFTAEKKCCRRYCIYFK